MLCLPHKILHTLVECIWGYLTHHAMPNYCATNFTDLA